MTIDPVVTTGMATPMVLGAAERLMLRTEAPLQMIDITEAVATVVLRAGLAEGVASVFCPHTSCGLAITEAEDGHHEDLAAVLEELAPEGRAWAHDDLSRRWQNIEPDERRNGWSHLRSLLATSPSLVVPVLDGALALGRWQALFLVELDGRVPGAPSWCSRGDGPPPDGRRLTGPACTVAP